MKHVAQPMPELRRRVQPIDRGGGLPVWLVLLACLLYVPLIGFGYGSDNDTYGVLDAARYWLSIGSYTPSRNPGFMVHEFTTGVLDKLGGSLATNLASVYFGVLALRSFWALAREFDVPHRTLLTVAMMVQARFWIASTCTHDYVWALGLGLAGLAAFAEGRPVLASLALALAIATRITSVMFVAALVAAWPRRASLGVALGALALGGAAYLLPFAAAGWSLGFLEAGVGGPEYLTPWLRFGRFFYKNLYFWGLPAVAVFAVAALAALLRGSAGARPQWSAAVRLSLALIVGIELTFLKFPLEPSYLLPTLPAVLLLFGMISGPKPIFAAALAIAILSLDVVNLNVARPNVPDRASDASFGIWTEPGILVSDLTTRMRLRGCDSFDCWDHVIKGRPDWWRKG